MRNLWDDFTDWLERCGEYLDANVWAIALVVVLLLGIGAGISLLAKPDLGFETRQIGQVVLLEWDAPDGGADLYEIQGRQFSGEWNSFMYSEHPFAQIGIPEGVISFRVRAWTKSGPGKWSTPTEYFLFVIPAGIETEKPRPKTKPAGLKNLNWTFCFPGEPFMAFL